MLFMTEAEKSTETFKAIRVQPDTFNGRLKTTGIYYIWSVTCLSAQRIVVNAIVYEGRH